MEKENGNICLIKEHEFYIMGYGVSNELTKYEKIKRTVRMRQNMDVFTVCPEYETEHFKIRKLEAGDVEGLFPCYSDPEAARYFNGDCCGDDFYYTDKEKFRECVEYWLSRYEARDFVRWSIFDKGTGLLVGTIEVCPSLKYAVDGKMMGILRIDLRSKYEKQAVLEEICCFRINCLTSEGGLKWLTRSHVVAGTDISLCTLQLGKSWAICHQGNMDSYE